MKSDVTLLHHCATADADDTCLGVIEVEISSTVFSGEPYLLIKSNSNTRAPSG